MNYLKNIFTPTANEAHSFAAAFALALSTYVYWLFTGEPLNNYWESSAIAMCIMLAFTVFTFNVYPKEK